MVFMDVLFALRLLQWARYAMQLSAGRLIRVVQVLSIALLLASCGGGGSDTPPAQTTAPTPSIATALPSSAWTSATEGTSRRPPAPGTAHSFLHVWNGSSDTVFRIDPDSGALSTVGILRFENVFTSGFAIHPAGKFAYALRSRGAFTGDDYLTAYTIDAATGALTPIGAPEAFPWGGFQIAVHPSG